MKKSLINLTTVLLILSCILFSCAMESGGGTRGPRADWARTPTVSALSSHSRFFGLANDSSGNIYAAGSMTGTNPFTFGGLSPVSGTSNNPNALLVKYNTYGSAVFVQTPTTTTDGYSRFYGTTVDTNGNIYAAGHIMDGTYQFGSIPQTEVTKTHSGFNCVLVKYDSAGTAVWAQGASDSKSSFFHSVTADLSGNIYAAGYIQDATYTFGIGTTNTVTGVSPHNAVLVKYDSSGAALFAMAISGGAGGKSDFLSVTCDASGNVYAAGYLDTGTYTLGGTTITNTSGKNGIVVKFSPAGNITQIFYRENTPATEYQFNSVSIDGGGNVIAAGGILQGTINFSSTVSAQGTVSGSTCLLVKYDSAATPLWAKTVSGSDISIFNSVYADSNANIYAAGEIDSISNYDFGNGVIINGSSYTNCVAVKYNSAGNTQWAFSVFGTDYSVYNAIIEDIYGRVYAAGIMDNGYFDFGGASVTGQAAVNCVLVKYCQ